MKLSAFTPLQRPQTKTTRFGNAASSPDPLDAMKTIHLDQARIRVEERFVEARAYLGKIADLLIQQQEDLEEKISAVRAQRDDKQAGWFRKVRLGWKLSSLENTVISSVPLTSLKPGGHSDSELMAALQILQDGSLAKINNRIYRDSNDRSYSRPVNVSLTPYGQDYLKKNAASAEPETSRKSHIG